MVRQRGGRRRFPRDERRRAMRAVALAICISLLPTPSLLAQQVSHEHSRRYIDPEKGLTIDELVILARRRSPSAAAAQDRIAEAKAELDQAGRQRPPSVSFEQREQAG